MRSPDTILPISPADAPRITEIAAWYQAEFGVPLATTHARLEKPGENSVLFQIGTFRDGKLIATGGLYNEVGVLRAYPELRVHGPWIALLMVHPDFRNQGLGGHLLAEIERLATEMDFPEVFLHTFTAERLYLRLGYTAFRRVEYKGHETAIMRKRLL